MHYLTDFLRRLWTIITAPIRMILFQSPRAIISSPRRLMGLSLPARVTILSVFYWLIIAIVSFLIFLRDEQSASVWHWFRVNGLWVVAGFVGIPLLVYKAVKLWLEEDVSPHEDIDRAWNAGLAAIEEHGLDVRNIPIFVVLGLRDDEQARDLFQASKLHFSFHDVPQGPAALHWYANPDAMYLACTQVGQLSRLAAVGETDGDFDAPMAGQSASSDPSQTLVLGRDETLDEPESDEEPDDGGAAAGEQSIYQTMMLDVGLPQLQQQSKASAPSSKRPRRGLSKAEAQLETERLKYVCQLLRQARQPLCPTNGILALLTFDQVYKNDQEVKRTARSDLVTASQTTRLRCPTLACVTGMEAEEGFQELVRRLGPENAKRARFGKGTNVWNPPKPEHVYAVAKHACGAFEDFSYSLFSRPDGLNKPGNTKLFALLCKIRSYVREPLANLLADSFAHDVDDQDADREPLLFGGCYFAATGNSDDKQAFLASVVHKLTELQGDLAWTGKALQSERRYQSISNVMLAVNVGLVLVGIVLMILHARGTFS